MGLKKRMLLGICSSVLFLSSLSFASPSFTRAIWVTRWDWESPQDIEKIIINASYLHFNRIFFQVRGDGTTLYPSGLEPWSRKFDFKDPGWDPLETAINLAHKHGLELHAWANVYPAWAGETPPAVYSQLYFTKPHWLMRDQFGNSSALNRHYLWLSPTNPQVAEYLLCVFAEIYQKYQIDGIHLDYIRFPGNVYSYDQVSLDLFRLECNATPEQKPFEWENWRRSAISQMIKQLYQKIKDFRPDVELSASVAADYQLGKNLYLQDSHDWLAQGIMDAIYPMIYTSDNTIFFRQLEQHKQNSHGRYVHPGILVHDSIHVEQQIRIAEDMQCDGVALFSYQKLFPGHQLDAAFLNSLPKLWFEKAKPAKTTFEKDKDSSGPHISEVHTWPQKLFPNKEFKLLAKITDPSGMYHGQSDSPRTGVHLIYGREYPKKEEKVVSMRPLQKAPEWYITTESITLTEPGIDFRGRIFAWDDCHENGTPKRNPGFSDIWSLSVLTPNETFLSAGYFGPVLYGACSIETDFSGQVWTGCNSDDDPSQVVVLDSTGRQAWFSPIKIEGLWNNYSLSGLRIQSLAFMPSNTMCIAATADVSCILKFRTTDGLLQEIIDLNFRADDMKCDEDGHIFILEENSTRWHVLSQTGMELRESPYGVWNTGNTISVLDSDKTVFIGDRTSGSIQCWKGGIIGNIAKYRREPNIPIADMGLGKMTSAGGNYVYVAHTSRGIISIHDKDGNPVEYFADDASAMKNPLDLCITSSGNRLYVLEIAIEGPRKLILWMKKSRLP